MLNWPFVIWSHRQALSQALGLWPPDDVAEQLCLPDAKRVSVEDSRQRVDVDVGEAFGGESVRRQFVDGLKTHGRELQRKNGLLVFLVWLALLALLVVLVFIALPVLLV